MYKSKTDYLKIIKELKERGEVFPATNYSVFKSLIQDEDLKDYTAFLISNCGSRILSESDVDFINIEETKKTINLSYRIGRKIQYDQINFDDFNNENNLVSIYKIVNIKTGEEDLYGNNFVKYRVNLALVYKKYYNHSKELTMFEKALVILTLRKIKDLHKVAEEDEMLMRVVKKIEELSENPDLVMSIYDEKAMKF